MTNYINLTKHKNEKTVNYYAKQDSFAKLDPSMELSYSARNNNLLRAEPKVSAGKEWIMDGQIGRGCKGWTTVVENGKNKYHYTTDAAYADSAETLAYYSERVWGQNTVYASTGIVGKGALHHISVFYGWE